MKLVYKIALPAIIVALAGAFAMVSVWNEGAAARAESETEFFDTHILTSAARTAVTMNAKVALVRPSGAGEQIERFEKAVGANLDLIAEGAKTDPLILAADRARRLHQRRLDGASGLDREIGAALLNVNAAAVEEAETRMASANARIAAVIGDIVLSVVLGAIAPVTISAAAAVSVLRPIRALSDFAEVISRDGEAELPALADKNDEIGRLGQALGRMIDRLRARAFELEALAYRDPETGLFNRAGVAREIDRALRISGEENGEADAPAPRTMVALLTFPRLSWIQDMLDEQASRDAAVEIAARLNQLLERSIGEDAAFGSFVVAGRPGFDQFVVGIRAPDDRIARRLLRRIESVFAEPLDFGDFRIAAQPVGGVAYAPDHGGTSGALLGAAGIASSMAPRGGRPLEFAAEMREKGREDQAALERLEDAIRDEDVFEPFLQAQIDVATGRTVGAEALIRWRKADGGLIPPIAFLPLAEGSGHIVQLDDIILRKAAAIFARLNASGPALRLSCNSAPIAFEDSAFADRILWRLDQAGLDPAQFQLEITETAAIADIARTRETIGRLKSAGVRIALDDFGSGHANLNALRELPIDSVKLDRALMPKREDDDGAKHIVETVTRLSRALDVEVIAEGVEYDWQFDFLRSIGCHKSQGFLHARPLPAADFEEMLAQEAAASGARVSA